MVSQYLVCSKGVGTIQRNLYWPHLKRVGVVIPPSVEQEAIVRFLASVNGRLERAIQAKRKVIALLNEQKQSIIHRAVTRGLNPSVALKPSGIPWLGDIPQHWETVPNRSYLKLRKRLVGERSKEFNLLSLTLRGIIARDMENPTGKWPASFNNYQEVLPGDLVFCLFDIDETPRFVGLSTLLGMITGAYTVFGSSNAEIAQWAYQFYLAMDFDKRLKPAYTGLRKVIQTSTFLGLKTPLPPPEERQEILGEMESSTAAFISTISRLEHEIELLRDYRRRLVTDVVTGKLDVREGAAQLSVEVLPDAPIDDTELSDEDESAGEEAAI
jgi:type I restriction enzyme S subunit